MSAVVTRFAPSPTGLLHIGGVRTALFSWLYARRMRRPVHPARRGHGPRALHATRPCRSSSRACTGWASSTTRGRSTRRSVSTATSEVIARDAQGRARPITATAARKSSTRCAPRRQRARKSRATTAAAARQRPGAASGRRAGGALRESATRARRWSRTWCTAQVTFQNTELDDLIIARSDGTPTYNFCVVVDDMDMGVTHVIRGDDHLNNTPRQMNMLLALGATPPVYAHVPMILGPGRREALQAPWRGQRAPVPGGGLSARGAAQLPGAPRLVARRPGILHARGDDRGVRHARRQQGRLGVQPGEAAVAQPAAHDASAAEGHRAAPALAPGAPRHRVAGRRAARGHHAGAARAREDAEGDGGEQPLLLRRRRRRSIRRPRRST